MELLTALIVYLIIVILIYYLARTFLLITIWSSLVLSLVIGLIFISALCPISSVERVMHRSWLVTIYTFIYVVTSLLALFYIIERSLKDVDKKKLKEFPIRGHNNRREGYEQSGYPAMAGK